MLWPIHSAGVCNKVVSRTSRSLGPGPVVLSENQGSEGKATALFFICNLKRGTIKMFLEVKEESRIWIKLLLKLTGASNVQSYTLTWYISSRMWHSQQVYHKEASLSLSPHLPRSCSTHYLQELKYTVKEKWSLQSLSYRIRAVRSLGLKLRGNSFTLMLSWGSYISISNTETLSSLRLVYLTAYSGSMLGCQREIFHNIFKTEFLICPHHLLLPHS